MATTNEEQGGGAEPKITPKFSAIFAMIAAGGDITEAAKAQQEAMSKLGAAFKKVEKEHHGNRQAVALIRKLDNMSKDKRDDFIRTLEPMLVERGFTLDVIDPEDLVGNTKQAAPKSGADADDDDEGGDDDQEGDSGPAAAPLPIASALAASRARLSGAAAEPGVDDASKADLGSRNLRKLIGALRTNQSLTEAANYAGMSMGEAQRHAEAEQRGEYADIVPITPGARSAGKGRPQLGIVTGGGN